MMLSVEKDRLPILLRSLLPILQQCFRCVSYKKLALRDMCKSILLSGVNTVQTRKTDSPCVEEAASTHTQRTVVKYDGRPSSQFTSLWFRQSLLHSPPDSLDGLCRRNRTKIDVISIRYRQRDEAADSRSAKDEKLSESCEAHSK